MIRKCFKLFGPVTATGYLLNKTVKSDQFGFNSCFGLNVKVFAQEWEYNWDGEEARHVCSDKIRKLIFIRHGSYENDGGRGGLVAAGRAEASSAGNRLLEMVSSGKYRITRLHTSSMQRAEETLDVIIDLFWKAGQRLPRPEVSSLHVEGHPNPKYPLTALDMKKEMKSDRQYWKDGARIDACFREHFRRDGCTRALKQEGHCTLRPISDTMAPPSESEDNVQNIEVYVGHSNVHRYYICRALQIPLERFLYYANIPGSFTEFSIHSDGTITCDSIGDCDFVRAQKLSLGIQ